MPVVKEEKRERSVSYTKARAETRIVIILDNERNYYCYPRM